MKATHAPYTNAFTIHMKVVTSNTNRKYCLVHQNNPMVPVTPVRAAIQSTLSIQNGVDAENSIKNIPTKVERV